MPEITATPLGLLVMCAYILALFAGAVWFGYRWGYEEGETDEWWRGRPCLWCGTPIRDRREFCRQCRRRP